MKKLFVILLVIAWATAARGEIAVWSHPCLQPMVKEAPAPGTPSVTMSFKVTPGEYEPAAFAVRSEKAAPLIVSLSGLEGLGWLPPDWCELHKVASLDESTQPNRLHEFENPLNLQPGITQFFWITVRPPADARPGKYIGRVFLQSVHEVKQLEIRCEVLPFRLEKSPITGGTFMDQTNLPPAWYRDMKEHGLNAIQYFWGYNAHVTRQDEELAIDLSRMDNFMADFNACGMTGPVIISLGNDYHMHYERRIAEAYGMPIDTSKNIDGKRIMGPPISPKLDKLFADGLRQIRDHWKRKEYPQELVVLIYDEPTERLLERGKNRYDLLKTVMPDTRVYGVVMDRRIWAEQMLDQCDIIVANGDLTGCRKLARQNGKGYWVYSGPLGSPKTARYKMGSWAWRAHADGVFFWMYNYWSYDLDGCAVYPHPDDRSKLVRSTAWESVREGMDDLRYIATAESLIDKAKGEKKRAAAARLKKLRQALDPEIRKRDMAGKENEIPQLPENHDDPELLRQQVLEIILDLL